MSCAGNSSLSLLNGPQARWACPPARCDAPPPTAGGWGTSLLSKPQEFSCSAWWFSLCIRLRTVGLTAVVIPPPPRQSSRLQNVCLKRLFSFVINNSSGTGKVPGAVIPPPPCQLLRFIKCAAVSAPGLARFRGLSHPLHLVRPCACQNECSYKTNDLYFHQTSLPGRVRFRGCHTPFSAPFPAA